MQSFLNLHLMRGLAVFSVFLFFMLNGNAQLMLMRQDLPEAGKRYVRAQTNPSSIAPGPSGGNQTWDFHSLSALSRDTLTFLSVSQTPIAYQFYFNNPILYPEHFSSFAQETDPINLFNQVTITDRYLYFRVDTAYKITGFGATVNNIPMSVKYDDVEELIPIPLQMGQGRKYTGAYLVTIPQMGTYGQMIEREVVCDAEGTLILPNQTYSVLRTVTTLKVTDTVFYPTLNIGMRLPRPTQTIYQWWGKNQGIPLVELTLTQNIPTQATYKESEVTSIEPVSTAAQWIHYDFIARKVRFLIPTELRPYTHLTLYRNDGVQLWHTPYQPEWTLEDLAQGIYFVKIVVLNTTLIQPIVIVN